MYEPACISLKIVCARMASNVDIEEEAKKLVLSIISENNFNLKCDINYFDGSEAGDGYGSKTMAVDIKDDEKTLHLFLKCALTTFRHESLDKIYATEIALYKEIIPAYYKFLESRGITDGFRNVPKCYGAQEKPGSEILVLENLKKRNFVLFDKSKYMNDNHLNLLLKTFAKFHAISFAFKDQRKQVHDEFCKDRPNIFVCLRLIRFEDVIAQTIRDFLKKLNPDTDSDILLRAKNLDTQAKDAILNMDKYLDKYAILTKGDCWVNNTMLLYEDQHKENPIDVMLIDWQGVTLGSPVHDLGAFFMSVSSKSTIENYTYYLKIYHNELCKRIRELGSDPDILYPFSVFEDEWRRHAIYAFGLSLFMLKMMLCKKENAPVFDTYADDSGVSPEKAQQMFLNVNDDEEQYLLRAKYIARHLIQIGSI